MLSVKTFNFQFVHRISQYIYDKTFLMKNNDSTDVNDSYRYIYLLNRTRKIRLFMIVICMVTYIIHLDESYTVLLVVRIFRKGFVVNF